MRIDYRAEKEGKEVKTFPTIRKATSWLAMITTALLLGTAQAAAQSPEPGPIVVSKSPSMVTFAGGTTKSVGRLKVRIAGPDGQTVYEAVSDAGLLDWVPEGNLPDGRYHWDAWLTPQPTLDDPRNGYTTKPDSKQTVKYRSGALQLRSGILVMREDHAMEEQASVSWPQRAFGAVLGMLVAPAAAQDTHSEAVTITDDNADNLTTVSMESDGDSDAGLCNVGGSLLLFVDGDCIFGSQEVTISASAPSHSMFIDSAGDVGLGTSTPDESIHIVDIPPTIRFERSGSNSWWVGPTGNEAQFFRIGSNEFFPQFFMHRDAPAGAFQVNALGRVGLGTEPENRLHVDGDMKLTGNAPAINFDNTTGDNINWQIGEAGDNLRFRQLTGTNTGAHLLLEVDGNIGMGTSSPDAPLHVQRSNGTAKVFVHETNATAGVSDLLELRNPGQVKFMITDSSSGRTWDFSNRNNGFNINLLGTGGQEFLIRNNGEFVVGPGGTENFKVEADGDVFVTGTLVHSSSRTVKEAITSVDGNAVLEKLGQLNVAEWSYKKDGKSKRHLSPMAEDFHATFGLGPDSKHISPSDLAGVALAAAKALKDQTSHLQSENHAKDQRITELETRMARLEAMLTD